jgi:hypothetical protein
VLTTNKLEKKRVVMDIGWTSPRREDLLHVLDATAFPSRGIQHIVCSYVGVCEVCHRLFPDGVFTRCYCDMSLCNLRVELVRSEDTEAGRPLPSVAFRLKDPPPSVVLHLTEAEQYRRAAVIKTPKGNLPLAPIFDMESQCILAHRIRDQRGRLLEWEFTVRMDHPEEIRWKLAGLDTSHPDYWISLFELLAAVPLIHVHPMNRSFHSSLLHATFGF